MKSNIKNRLYEVKARAKARAKAKKIPFDLSPNDICIPKVCPVFNTVLKDGVGFNDPNGAALDRVNANKGYEKNNVQLISNRANAIKNNGTISDHQKIIAYMKERKYTNYSVDFYEI